MAGREWSPADRKEQVVGWFCAVSCALIWGLLPVYWKTLHPLPPVLIMFYRLVLACGLVFAADLALYGWNGTFAPLRRPGAARTFLISGLLIAANWSLYIYMVNAGLVIQTSIGYYIEPLIVTAFGVIFFREKPDRFKIAAICLAALGVLVMLLAVGRLPILSICLATSFALYAAVKKQVRLPALLTLFYETVMLLPVALGVIVYMEATGRGALALAAPGQLGWLALSGLLTALPLVLFAMAANRISLVELGISGYLAPSVGLILGIFLFREPFDRYQLIGFGVIWIGLAVLTIGGWSGRRRSAIPEKPTETAGERT